MAVISSVTSREDAAEMKIIPAVVAVLLALNLLGAVVAAAYSIGLPVDFTTARQPNCCTDAVCCSDGACAVLCPPSAHAAILPVPPANTKAPAVLAAVVPVTRSGLGAERALVSWTSAVCAIRSYRDLHARTGRLLI